MTINARTLPIASVLFSLTLVAGCNDGSATDPSSSNAEHDSELVVYHDPNCGCCSKWIEHMEENGFQVESRLETNMNRVKHEHGVPRELPSCHTAIINDYVIEGHVPASDVKRLLDENPRAKGLSVPGMPLGSPGMEHGNRRQAYDVVLFDESGETEVFNHYPARD